jgi:hypothetical protein
MWTALQGASSKASSFFKSFFPIRPRKRGQNLSAIEMLSAITLFLVLLNNEYFKPTSA